MRSGNLPTYTLQEAVAHGREEGWTPDQLCEKFNDLDPTTAQLLLQGVIRAAGNALCRAGIPPRGT